MWATVCRSIDLESFVLLPFLLCIVSYRITSYHIVSHRIRIVSAFRLRRRRRRRCLSQDKEKANRTKRREEKRKESFQPSKRPNAQTTLPFFHTSLIVHIHIDKTVPEYGRPIKLFAVRLALFPFLTATMLRVRIDSIFACLKLIFTTSFQDTPRIQR